MEPCPEHLPQYQCPATKPAWSLATPRTNPIFSLMFYYNMLYHRTLCDRTLCDATQSTMFLLPLMKQTRIEVSEMADAIALEGMYAMYLPRGLTNFTSLSSDHFVYCWFSDQVSHCFMPIDLGKALLVSSLFLVGRKESKTNLAFAQASEHGEAHNLVKTWGQGPWWRPGVTLAWMGGGLL